MRWVCKQAAKHNGTKKKAMLLMLITNVYSFKNFPCTFTTVFFKSYKPSNLNSVSKISKIYSKPYG